MLEYQVGVDRRFLGFRPQCGIHVSQHPLAFGFDEPPRLPDPFKHAGEEVIAGSSNSSTTGFASGGIEKIGTSADALFEKIIEQARQARRIIGNLRNGSRPNAHR